MLGATPAHPVTVGLGVGSGPRGMPGRAGVGGTPGGGGGSEQVLRGQRGDAACLGDRGWVWETSGC